MRLRTWEAPYKGHTIRVENHLFGERLLIDGKVHDSRSGVTMRVRLEGQIASGNQSEPVSAQLGGFWRTSCRLAVSGVPLPVHEVDEASLVL